MRRRFGGSQREEGRGRWLALAALLVAAPGLAGVTGEVSVQAQGLSLLGQGPEGSTRSTASLLLQENLGLHYSGMPFGPSVALLQAGLEAMNVNVWGTGGALVSGRAATLDLSVGLLPRRSLPVRLYVRGTIAEGGAQSIATLGGRESLLYGVGVNLEPGEVLPGLRLEAQEHRFTGLGTTTPLGDLRRSASAATFKAFGEHQVSLGVRFDQEQRTALGAWMGASVNGSWLSPVHQTTLLLSWLDRTQQPAAIPGLQAGVERSARVAHVQRLGPNLSVEASARLGDARFHGATGLLAGGALGATFRPFEAHELLLSAGAEAGYTETRRDGDPAAAPGRTAAGNARASYARVLGPVRLGVVAGGGAQWCGCVGLADGALSTLEAGASVASLGLQHLDLQGDYTLLWVTAPLGRGGKRLEHHGHLSGRTRLGPADLVLTLGYDDGFRDFIDVKTGVLSSLHEQVFAGSLGGTAALGAGSVSAEVRHLRGAALVAATPFIDGPPPTARVLTNVNVNGLYPVTSYLEVTAGGLASWTVLDTQQPLTTLGAQAGTTLRLGRLTASLQYQFVRSDTAGLLTTQHLLRLYLSRPFEF